MGKPFKAQAYVTVKFDPAATDVLLFNGVIVKGPSVGATVTGRLYLDAVTKISPAPKPPVGNGYAYDATTAGHCTDGTANNASMLHRATRHRYLAAGTTGELRRGLRLPGGVVTRCVAGVPGSDNGAAVRAGNLREAH